MICKFDDFDPLHYLFEQYPTASIVYDTSLRNHALNNEFLVSMSNQWIFYK